MLMMILYKSNKGHDNASVAAHHNDDKYCMWIIKLTRSLEPFQNYPDLVDCSMSLNFVWNWRFPSRNEWLKSWFKLGIQRRHWGASRNKAHSWIKCSIVRNLSSQSSVEEEKKSLQRWRKNHQTTRASLKYLAFCFHFQCSAKKAWTQ